MLEHLDENTNISFKNVTSHKKDFVEVKNKVDTLLRFAPSESVCHLHVSSFKGQFKGILKISSKDQNFYIEQVAETNDDLQKILFKLMYKELDQWKKKRSVDECTGIILLNTFSIEKKKVKKN